MIVSAFDEMQIGRHFQNAAVNLQVPLKLLEVSDAWSSNLWINRFHHHLRGHYPARLKSFSQKVLDACRDFEPTILLAAGNAPIDEPTLRQINHMGTITSIYLTDDPFNPVLRSSWLMRALPAYHSVFSPRYDNMDDLRRVGCQNLNYLPFAYAPEVHYRQPPDNQEDWDKFASDVLFVGGADKDRIGYMYSLSDAGYKLALYGGKWNRYRRLSQFYRGFADATTGRKAAAAARLMPCLVRRANRDGHCMRTYELPAMHASMAVEDTAEHREIFGPPGECALYFRTEKDLIECARTLIANDSERFRMASACHARIVGGRNTYSDRLEFILAYSLGHQ